MPEKGRTLGKELWIEFLTRWKEKLWKFLNWLLEVSFVKPSDWIMHGKEESYFNFSIIPWVIITNRIHCTGLAFLGK